MKPQNVLIMGAAGRDFHNFNMFFRGNDAYKVVAFTATQIPDIAGRKYPAALAGKGYPQGIPIFDEKEMPELIKKLKVELVVFSYSDQSHEDVMHKGSIAMAAGADFMMMGPDHTMVKSSKPVISICAVRTGCGKSQTTRRVAEILLKAGQEGRGGAPPHALRRSREAEGPALRHPRRPGQARVHHRGARGVRAAHRPRRDHLRRGGLRGHPPAGREGGRHRPLGRRQQRPALLQVRPRDRGRGPAPPRPRSGLLPRRDEHPQGGRHRDQQDRHGLRRRHRRGPLQRRTR